MKKSTIAVSVAYRYAAEAEEDQEDSGGGGGVSATLLKFFEEHEDKKVENPATGNQVKYQTAFGYDKSSKPYQAVLDIYKKWLEDNDLKEETSQEEEAGEKPKSDAISDVDVSDESEIESWKKNLPKNLKQKSEKELALLMGVSGTGKKHDVSVSFDDFDPPPGMVFSTKGKGIKKMYRKLTKDSGGPYIYNEVLHLESDAPKGTGTKILSSQVEQARSDGIDRIVCTAHRDDKSGFVGHYVWARLGFDGNIHEKAGPYTQGNPNSKEDLKKAVEAGELPKRFLKATMASEFMKDAKAREWWKKNGWSFKGTFDTKKESMSSKVFDAYLKNRK